VTIRLDEQLLDASHHELRFPSAPLAMDYLFGDRYTYIISAKNRVMRVATPTSETLHRLLPKYYVCMISTSDVGWLSLLM
jgi:hypothetical protein